MKLLNKKAQEWINDYIQANLEKINVKSGNCRYNYKCQLNAVHEALNNDEDKIAMVFYRCYNDWFIHFLNVNKEGEYIDNTIGRWSEIYEYAFVKFIYKKEFFDIDDIFDAQRNYLRSKMPFMIRILSDEIF